MEELFRFINVSCETSRFYLRNFSFMFGRGELIAISSDTTSAKDALVHLPNINPTGVEAKIFQTLINELANRGTSVLVVVAASSEILTRADNLFEFDQEGNCYQKLDHQNHR